MSSQLTVCTSKSKTRDGGTSIVTATVAAARRRMVGGAFVISTSTTSNRETRRYLTDPLFDRGRLRGDDVTTAFS